MRSRLTVTLATLTLVFTTYASTSAGEAHSVATTNWPTASVAKSSTTNWPTAASQGQL